MDDLLLWFGGSPSTIPYAADYLYIVIPASIFTSLSFGYNAIMRASGYPKKAMVTMITGAALNIILDPIFIFGFDMGIQGAAMATVISMAVSATLVMKHFLHPNSLLRLKPKCLKIDAHVIRLILTIGVSPFAMQLAGSLVSVIMNQSLQQYGGDLAIGANGIIVSFAMMMDMIVVGIAQGMQPVVGFNFGAGLHQRVMDTLRWTIIIATAVTGTGWVAAVFMPDIIVNLFTSDPALRQITANGLPMSLAMFVVVGSGIVLTRFFQSVGQAGVAVFLSLSRQCIFLIPALLLLPSIFDLDGVWYAVPLSDILSVITAWVLLWRYQRKTLRISTPV
jgi:putative MATE family efflux protein